MNTMRSISPREVGFNNFAVKYGNHTALSIAFDGFRLDGQTIGLFGPNGAGKTTMLRSIAGLVNRFSGTLSAPSYDAISYVPDEPYLYRFLKVGQCVDIFTERYPDFERDKASALINRLNLPTDRSIGSFSKGQAEQLHILLGFSRRCSLYILDEPLAAVDPYTRDRLLEVIHESAEVGATIMMSTHIISEVESLFSHVIMINDGHIIANDTVERFKSESGTLESAFKDRMARQ